MGRFNRPPEPAPKSKTPDPQNMKKVGGSYQCQSCYEVVTSALYAPDTGQLAWRCSKGHQSMIGDFFV